MTFPDAKSRRVWKAAFLGLTGAVVTLELVAAYNNKSNIEPWTTMVVEHVPGEVTFPVLTGIGSWLVVHFGVRYYQRKWSQGRL